MPENQPRDETDSNKNTDRSGNIISPYARRLKGPHYDRRNITGNYESSSMVQ